MDNKIESGTLPIEHKKEISPAEKSKTLSFRERSIERMGKFSWISVLNQLLMGLGLLYLAIWLSKPYLESWVIVVGAFLFLSGGYYGWYLSKQTDIQISKSGAAIFSYVGLWKKFIPMFVGLFLVRMILVFLDRREIVSMAPLMRTLTFFIAGVFTARGTTLLVMIYRLKKEAHQQDKKDIHD
jgi:uncharacterized membrane protein